MRATGFIFAFTASILVSPPGSFAIPCASDYAAYRQELITDKWTPVAVENSIKEFTESQQDQESQPLSGWIQIDAKPSSLFSGGKRWNCVSLLNSRYLLNSINDHQHWMARPTRQLASLPDQAEPGGCRSRCSASCWIHWEAPSPCGSVRGTPRSAQPIELVETPTRCRGTPQLCPLPVVPECQRSRLYASPKAGLRALIRLLKVLPPMHSRRPFLAQ